MVSPNPQPVQALALRLHGVNPDLPLYEVRPTLQIGRKHEPENRSERTQSERPRSPGSHERFTSSVRRRLQRAGRGIRPRERA